MCKINLKSGNLLYLDIFYILIGLISVLYVAIFKVFPHKFGIDWSKGKRQIYKDINIITDSSGNVLTKEQGKEIFFKKINKSTEQIYIDKISTRYMHSIVTLPQIAFILTGNFYLAGYYAIDILANTIIVSATKNIVHKKRPDGGNYKSFPSGHTATTAIFAGFVMRYSRLMALLKSLPFLIASILIGLSRIYCDRHDIYDVSFGLLVGFLIGYYMIDWINKASNFLTNRIQFLSHIKKFFLTRVNG